MTAGSPPALPRRLGLGGATAIGVGAMLGTGVFAAWTPALNLAGTLLLPALLLAAAVAGLNAWSTAALARCHPQAGGAYAYGRVRLGRGAGVLAGWAFVVGKTASAGAAALTIGAYVLPAQQRLVGLIAIVAVLLLDLRGVTRTATASGVLSAVVVAVLVALATAVVLDRPADVSMGTPAPDGPLGLLAAAGLLFVAFAGYARVATLGEEVRQPTRVLPRAIALSFGIVLGVYLVVGLCVASVLGPLAEDERSAAPLEQVAALAAGPMLSGAVRIAAVLAAGGALLSLLAGIGRTLFAMGRGGDAPAALTAVSPHGVPHRAQVVAATAAALVVLVGGIAGALGLSAVCILTYYGIAHLAALRMARSAGRPPTLVPVVGLLGCAVVVGAVLLVAAGRG